jgi:hypothetical protein
MARSGQMAAPRTAAAIHDLGYKRYLGSRRPQSTRWRVLVKNTLSTSWRGWWRMKAWVIGCAITTFGFGVPIFIAHDKVFEELMKSGLATRWADELLLTSFRVFGWLAFILCATTSAGAVARDLRAGAFEFYFSRPVRTVDYALGKVVGSVLVAGTALLAGPLLLGLFRVGLSRSLDDVPHGLSLVPRIALVGVVGAIAYGSLALAFSSLSTRPRITVAMWCGFYILFGVVIEGIALALRMPDLAALSLPRAMFGFGAGLFEAGPSILPGFHDNPPGLVPSCAALAGYALLGLVVLQIRVKLAERAGLGGG